jgi:hypothetical protein
MINYKLTFLKISENNEYAGVGFAGNIFIILNALTYIGDLDYLYVDMETNKCVCNENNFLLYDTKNCWEYFFNQTIKINDVNSNLDFFLPTNYNSIYKLTYDNKNNFMNPTEYVGLKNKFYSNFTLKEVIKKTIDEYYYNYIKNKVTLGVQIRLTDMKKHHNVCSLDRYIYKIIEIIKEKKDIEQIFLATDDGTIIYELRNQIKIPIIWYEDMFRADEKNPHLTSYVRYVDINQNRLHHKYKMGVECLQEIFTLSKCDYLLKADISSISNVAVILSDKIKVIYNV